MSDTSVAKLQQQLDQFDARERKALLNGVVATQVILAQAGADGVVGDVVCVAQGGPVPPAAPTVLKATMGVLASAGSAFGVLIESGKAGTAVYCALDGIIPPSVTGLSPGVAGYCRVNAATGRCERIASFTAGNFMLGWVDPDGNLTLCPSVAFTNGSPTLDALFSVEVTSGLAAGNVDATVLSVAALPAGASRYLLTRIIAMVTQVPVGSGTLQVRIGTTVGGNDVMTDQPVTSASTLRQIIGGLQGATLGMAMTAANLYELALAAAATLSARLALTGTFSQAAKVTFVQQGIVLP